MSETPDTFTSCPKCGTNIQYVGFGGIKFEHCQKCRGHFLDFHELTHPSSKKIDQDILALEEPDPDVDQKEIACPKCDVKMDKIKKTDKNIVVDSCPSCKGIWFDKGELYRFSNELKGKKLQLIFKCYQCNFKVDYKKASPKVRESLKCLTCNGSLGIIDINAVRAWRYWREDAFVFGIYFGIVFLIFLGTFFAFGSLRNAVLYTACVALPGLWWITIREMGGRRCW